MPIRQNFIRFAAIAAFSAMASIAGAQTFPSKQVTIYVPYQAGGAVDVLARTIGQSLSKTWGQTPIVENRPGAGGVIASEALAKSPPDGYRLILVASGHPLNQFFYPKLPYDTFKDFTPITEIAFSPLAFVVDKKSDAKTLQDVLAMAKQKPDTMSYGMSGNGTSAHLAGELLNHMAKVKIQSIPYKGGAPALTAVLAGDIPMSINPMPEVMGQVESGLVRVLAVSTATRAKSLPDVPTVSETGIVGYETAVWWGFLTPAGVPADIVTKLNADIVATLKDPAVLATLEKLGATPVGSSSQDFDAYMRAEAAKWGPILKDANIKMQ